MASLSVLSSIELRTVNYGFEKKRAHKSEDYEMFGFHNRIPHWLPANLIRSVTNGKLNSSEAFIEQI